MNGIKSIALFIGFILCLSCKNQPISNENQDQILAQIMPQLLDSIETGLTPPAWNDSIKAIYDNNKLHVIIADSTKILTIREQSLFLKHYPTISMDIDSAYQIPIEHGLVRFKNVHARKLDLHFPVKRKIQVSYRFDWKKKNTNPPLCMHLSFSNLMLDSSERFGVLSLDTSCCFDIECGQGHVIFLSKKGERWKIDKIESTWVA